MEKETPPCKLAVVKGLVEASQVRTTQAARVGADALGLSFSDLLDVVMVLTPADFYKSMTAHADRTVWQDVYLKLTAIDDVLIVSFKEL